MDSGMTQGLGRAIACIAIVLALLSFGAGVVCGLLIP